MRRRGFTLVELLVAITIIGILTGLFLGALSLSAQSAREARTKAMIARLNTAVLTRWESYRTRRVPLSWDATTQAWAATNWPALVPAQPTSLTFAQRAAASAPLQSRARLELLREIMRLELPQCWDDVTTPAGITTRPAVSFGYLRRYQAAATPPSVTNQSAECLYLIVTMGAIEEEASPLDQFKSMDVGDVDLDGFPEFLDGWGNPISFIRWPTAFISDLQHDPSQPDPITFARQYHDPFDPGNLDTPSAAGTPRGYKLTPLIYSWGPDGIPGLQTHHDTGALLIDDPYVTPASGLAAGAMLPADDNAWLDNIHNHHLGSLTK